MRVAVCNITEYGCTLSDSICFKATHQTTTDWAALAQADGMRENLIGTFWKTKSVRLIEEEVHTQQTKSNTPHTVHANHAVKSF